MVDGASLVKQLVEKHEQNLKSVQVRKQIPVTIDTHYLTCWDDNIVNSEKTPTERARENAQLLINEVFENTEHVNVDPRKFQKICKKSYNGINFFYNFLWCNVWKIANSRAEYFSTA